MECQIIPVIAKSTSPVAEAVFAEAAKVFIHLEYLSDRELMREHHKYP